MNPEMAENVERLIATGQCSTHHLGGAIVVSALATEWALVDLICAEADKVRAASCADCSCNGLAAVDDSVANVLTQVNNIECRVIEKLELGIDLITPAASAQ